MSAFENMMNAGHASMERVCPCTVTIGATSKTGVKTTVSNKLTTDRTGDMVQCDGYVTLRKAYFDDLDIVIGREFLLDGVMVRAAEIDSDGNIPVDVHYRKAR